MLLFKPQCVFNHKRFTGIGSNQTFVTVRDYLIDKRNQFIIVQRLYL